MIYDPNSGTIIMTEDGQNLKEQMRTQMREQFRGGNHGNMKTVQHEFEQGYREGYREGYEQAMRDAHEGGMNLEKMSPAEREAYLRGQRDAYGRNGAENRNQL
jgi:flagellar biosynthesis/type III secretory pathway protein FliH